ncbi:MAG: TIGR00266 family protein [Bradymonadaceae bacterium]
MKYDIEADPSFSTARVVFDEPGEEIVVEASAMAAKDSDVEMETSTRGGMLQAAKRAATTGESLFQNTFKATEPGQTLWISPPAEGDLQIVEMDGGDDVLFTSDNFVASGPGIEIDSSWEGAKGFFSGSSLFLGRATGSGPLFLGSYGGIHPVELDGSAEGYVVDNHHIVGFTEGLNYNVQRMGGLMSLGDEGYVCRFRGEGTIWVSTRSPSGLADFLHPYRRTASSNEGVE